MQAWVSWSRDLREEETHGWGSLNWDGQLKGWKAQADCLQLFDLEGSKHMAHN